MKYKLNFLMILLLVFLVGLTACDFMPFGSADYIKRGLSEMEVPGIVETYFEAIESPIHANRLEATLMPDEEIEISLSGRFYGSSYGYFDDVSYYISREEYVQGHLDNDRFYIVDASVNYDEAVINISDDEATYIAPITKTIEDADSDGANFETSYQLEMRFEKTDDGWFIVSIIKENDEE